jgi:hypothetical protein
MLLQMHSSLDEHLYEINYSYLIFAAEIKINIKNTTAFFNAMQTSCIKNRCMMDVLKVILFCSWGWSTRCARFPIYPTYKMYKIKSHF